VKPPDNRTEYAIITLRFGSSSAPRSKASSADMAASSGLTGTVHVFEEQNFQLLFFFFFFSFF
jgi:hypothetical protein